MDVEDVVLISLAADRGHWKAVVGVAKELPRFYKRSWAYHLTYQERLFCGHTS